MGSQPQSQRSSEGAGYAQQHCSCLCARGAVVPGRAGDGMSHLRCPWLGAWGARNLEAEPQLNAAPLHVQVIGCAIALSLLTWGAVPLWAGVLVTAVDSFALLLIERLGVRNLEAVFAVLITTMAVSFGVMYVLAGVPTAEVVEGAWQAQGLLMLVGVHPLRDVCAGGRAHR